MNLNFEQVLQIISIMAFFWGAVKFFVTIGEYKTIINTKIEAIEKAIKKLESEDELIHSEVEKIQKETILNSKHFEAILIEVKTKLELLISMTGMFKNRDEQNKRDTN